MRRVMDWIEERIELEGLLRFLRSKTVPHHRHSYIYLSGGVLLFLLALQVITGTLLLAHYSPGENTAFESIVHLMSQVPMGVYIRSVHSWGANLMVLFLFLHLFCVLLYKAYRRPRELTWMGGFLLFVLVLAFGFSGYLLPWNQLALAATKVGTDAPRGLGLPGMWISLLLRGGEDITGVTLGRFFALHVWGLPLLFFPLLALHLFLVQLQGMAVPPSIERKGGYGVLPFFPNFLYRDLILWLATLGIVLTLALLLPWPLGEKADPFAPTPEGIKPEWYFLFLFQTLKLFP
ncbi:MAG: cytochrome bc complex cytochrome b subunit, partial [candidate division NC10 bacterium]|nr:cytochrome bc complex cytochrome b subunit [candidate division NC10 bacterium]